MRLRCSHPRRRFVDEHARSRAAGRPSARTRRRERRRRPRTTQIGRRADAQSRSRLRSPSQARSASAYSEHVPRLGERDRRPPRWPAASSRSKVSRFVDRPLLRQEVGRAGQRRLERLRLADLAAPSRRNGPMSARAPSASPRAARIVRANRASAVLPCNAGHAGGQRSRRSASSSASLPVTEPVRVERELGAKPHAPASPARSAPRTRAPLDATSRTAARHRPPSGSSVEARLM